MKTSMMRIICAIFAFCILVCALSACGGDNGDNSTASKGNGDTDASITVSANKASVEEGSIYADPNWSPYASIPESIKGSTVRFATWIVHNETEGAPLLQNFNRDTGLNVELYIVAQNGYVDKLVTAIGMKDVPDVFVSNEGNQNFPLTMQFAAPINKVSSVDLNEPIWDKTMIKTATIDGNVYLLNTIGSPWSGSNLVYYNKTLFEENGFKTPSEYYEEGNWTWATMKKVMKDVTALGSDYKGGLIDPEILGDSAGVSFVMYDSETATFKSGVDRPELQATYQWYAEAREEGLLGGTMPGFIQGKVGIVTTGVYGLKATGHWKDMDPNDVGFTYLPALEDGTKGKISSIYRMYGIIAGAPNADAAGYFIRYWLDPDNYDLQNTFITPEAGQFYYALTNSTADMKYFNYDDACSTLIGATNQDVFISGARNGSSAQVNTNIQKVANVVNDAVNKSNEIIQKLKDANK